MKAEGAQKAMLLAVNFSQATAQGVSLPVPDEQAPGMVTIKGRRFEVDFSSVKLPQEGDAASDRDPATCTLLLTHVLSPTRLISLYIDIDTTVLRALTPKGASHLAVMLRILDQAIVKIEE